MAASKVRLDNDLRSIIRVARRKKRLTQSQAASKVGISEIWWSQLETGVKDVTMLDTLIDIIEVLGVPPRVLRRIGHEYAAQAFEERQDWFGSDGLDNWRDGNAAGRGEEAG